MVVVADATGLRETNCQLFFRPLLIPMRGITSLASRRRLYYNPLEIDLTRQSLPASVSCYFAGELFKLFSLWPAKKLQAEKNHACTTHTRRVVVSS